MKYTALLELYKYLISWCIHCPTSAQLPPLLPHFLSALRSFKTSSVPPSQRIPTNIQCTQQDSKSVAVLCHQLPCSVVTEVYKVKNELKKKKTAILMHLHFLPNRTLTSVAVLCHQLLCSVVTEGYK